MPPPPGVVIVIDIPTEDGEPIPLPGRTGDITADDEGERAENMEKAGERETAPWQQETPFRFLSFRC